MERFARLFQEVDSTTSTNEKVAALQRYFYEESPENAVWALYLLLGKVRKRLITSRMLRDIFLQISDIPEWLFEDCYAQVGDTAEVISLLLKDHSLRVKKTIHISDQETGHEIVQDLVKITVQESVQETIPETVQSIAQTSLQEWMEQAIPQVKQLDEVELRDRVISWWAALNTFEIFILNKLLTGGFRVGVSDKLVIKALAHQFDIPESVMAHRLMGDFEPTVEFFSSLIHPEGTVQSPTRPYPFFLASQLEEDRFAQEDFSRWLAEWKWDGIRAQVIRREGQVFIWSRGEDLITDQFPEIARAFLELPDGFVFDGEVLCWDSENQRPLNFNSLQKRLGRKRVTQKVIDENPAHFIAYDLLEHGGQDIRQKPLVQRRELLMASLQNSDPKWMHYSEVMTLQTFEEVQELRERSRQQGAEGLVIKAADSPYLVGRKRGYWWKHKVNPMTLDAVLIYAQAGSGKRANLFTDYTFALWNGEDLVPFAKAYSGLDNSEIDELDKWIRKHTREKFGPVRSVEPIQVFEIGFEGISQSNRHKSGIAVRFPRILRWRKDKPANEADTIQTAMALL